MKSHINYFDRIVCKRKFHFLLTYVFLWKENLVEITTLVSHRRLVIEKIKLCCSFLGAKQMFRSYNEFVHDKLRQKTYIIQKLNALPISSLRLVLLRVIVKKTRTNCFYLLELWELLCKNKTKQNKKKRQCERNLPIEKSLNDCMISE